LRRRLVCDQRIPDQSLSFSFAEDFPDEKTQARLAFSSADGQSWGAGVTQEAVHDVVGGQFKATGSTQNSGHLRSGTAYCTTQERIVIENVIPVVSSYVVMFST
jgi:hypothetical protein